MATQALVNPELLSWARLRSGLSESTLARKISVKVEKILEWESGDKKPTFAQAQNFAKYTHTPFGYLFLPKPPVEKLPIPDLRTLDGTQVDEVSTELRDILIQVMQKQTWFKEYLQSQDEEEKGFIGSFSLDSKVEHVALYLRTLLNVAVPTKGSWEDYFRSLINGAEDAGIMVMRSGIVGNNTHRKLQVSEFRGFALSDKLAPVVFINSSDAPTARLFTLIHELTHLLIGQTGISNVMQSHAREEVFCNAVAGEFLVPKSTLFSLWDKNSSILSNAQLISTRLHVSKFVAVRRALEFNFISQKEYNNFYNEELDAFRSKGGSGGDFYRTAGAKNSSILSHAIISEAFSGRMLMRDAGKLLGVAPQSLKTYASKNNL